MAKKPNSALGKGLNEIFGQDVSNMLEDIQHGKSENYTSGKTMIAVQDIKPNPYQPRKKFDEEKLNELKESITIHGVFTPILVKKAMRGYELIAGERRLRASKLAGLKEIPAIIVEFNDQQMMEIALLENIQRENLNVIEEAQAYEKMIQKLSYTQEELSNQIGKSREYVTNLLRLLKLPKKVQNYVIDQKLSMGHVRALLALKDEQAIEDVAQIAIRDALSVRAVEKLMKEYGTQSKPIKKIKNENKHLLSVRRQLEEKLQTRVNIDEKHISIQYQNDKDLNRILEILDCLEE